MTTVSSECARRASRHAALAQRAGISWARWLPWSRAADWQDWHLEMGRAYATLALHTDPERARVLMGLADMCVLDSWALGVPLSQCPALAYPASAIPGPGRAAQA